MYKIKYLSSARKDIADIYKFIALDNPVIALNVIEKIRKTIWYLSDFPFIWIDIENWLMKLVDTKYHYIIFYKINWSIIEIVSVFKNKNLIR